MRRSIFKAGVWTALGLAIAFAVVSANSNTRRAVTAAPAARATVATAASHDECVSSDVCCARKVNTATVAVAPRAKKATTKLGLAPGVAGMVVAIDPETGQLGMPSASQVEELQSQIVPSDDINRSTEGLQEVHHADGSVSIDVKGRFQEFATVRVLPNGTKVFGCADGPKAASSIPAASGLEEK
jgi:hypothetical protein